MTDEQRAAVERWNNTDGFACSAPEECIDDLHVLAAGFVAEHPADDDEPADFDWLNRLRSVNDQPLSMLAVRLCDDGFHLMAPGSPNSGIEGLNDYVAPEPATRGDVRRLCRALGITLNEQTGT